MSHSPSIAGEHLRILHVGSDLDAAQLTIESLSRAAPELEFVCTQRLESAVDLLDTSAFHAVLIDPSFGGDVASVRKLRDGGAEVPIVVLAPDADESVALQAVEAGAQDCLTKGLTDGLAVWKAIQLAIERHGQSPQPPARRPSFSLDPIRVLLVEENAGDALRIEESLNSGGGHACEVVTAGRLSNALKLLATKSFQAAVVDLALPDSQGLDTCRKLREAAPELTVIVHAGAEDDSLARQAVRSGASDFVAKSRTSGPLVARALRLALRRKPPRPKHGMSAAGPAMSEPRPRPSGPDVSPAAPAAPVGASAAAPVERRCSERYHLVRSVLAIPIEPGGRPDWDERLVGITYDLSRDGLGLELDARALLARTLMVGVERRDGTLCYAGMEVCHSSQRDPGRLRVGGRIGGRGEQILNSACHPTVFDSTSARLGRPVSEEVLQAWCEVEVLTPVLLDSVQVCPRCRALPTFRPGCRSCGSGRVVGEQLIHHFACAYVAPIAEFERPGGLVCPKCRARKLVVGSDYEYQIGATRCPDCQWHGAEPQQVGQCLMCHFRFPGSQALRLELKGYHVHRLDPLAFIAAS